MRGAFQYQTTNINNSKDANGIFVPSAQLTYNAISNQTIQKLEFEGIATPCIKFTNCTNLTIKYLKVKNPIKDTSGASYAGKNVCIYFENCTNCTVQYCFGSNFVNFVYAVNCTQIYVLDSYGLMCYRIMPRGQFVQFNDVQVGGIKRNKFYNPGGFENEDIINCFDTEDIEVDDNELKGTNTYSSSGTGFILGDASALVTPTRNLARRNKLVNTSQVGGAIAGGTNNEMSENQIFGSQQTNSNVGAYVGNYGGSPTCANNIFTSNQSNWRNAAGTLNNFFVDSVPPNECSGTIQTPANTNNPSLSANLIPYNVSEELYENEIYATI